METKGNRASGAMSMLCGLLLAGALCAPAAGAQNLASNGQFDSGIAGGQGIDASLLLFSATIDADDAPDSGSALLGNASAPAGNTAEIAQCLNGFVSLLERTGAASCGPSRSSTRSRVARARF